MAKLILTKADKDAKTWVELDSFSIGELVKANIYLIKENAEQEKKIFLMSTAIALCAVASETNADNMKVTIDGITKSGESIGDWEVSIKKLTHK